MGNQIRCRKHKLDLADDEGSGLASGPQRVRRALSILGV